MRTAYGRLALCLAVLSFLAPTAAFGQGLDMAPPTPLLPLPLMDRDESGFFVAGEFLFMRQNNPIENQTVATRGFIDVDGSVLGGLPGSHAGSGRIALSTGQVGGPISRQPGVALAAGWKFRNGTVIEATWWHLTDVRYSATASLIPQDFSLDQSLADTFLTSPVFNFPINYAGPAMNVAVGNAGATYGIWNASSMQQIQMLQRFDQGMINFRIPIDQGEEWRMFGFLGGRAVIMWERFKWRTVGADPAGGSAPDDVAIYSNVVSNRWYGANVGIGCDWYWGASKLGAFAASCELHGSVGIDIVKERAKYELADFSTAATRAINEYTVSPLLQGDVSLWWYPTQGIQVRLGWKALAVFNTVASPRPIDFNMGSITPEWERGITRIIRGMHVGIGFIF